MKHLSLVWRLIVLLALPMAGARAAEGFGGAFGGGFDLSPPAPKSSDGMKVPPSLILETKTAKPGDTVLLGIRFELEDDWHTFWRNPGGPGMPASVKWTLPEGVKAGEIQWPAPDKWVEEIEDRGKKEYVTFYVYHHEVVLLVPLKLADNLAPGDYPIAAKLRWQCCKNICVLSDAEAGATLTVGAERVPSEHAEVLAGWQKKVPVNRDDLKVTASWEEPSADGKTRELAINWTMANPPGAPDFFPFKSDDWEFSGKSTGLIAGPGTVRLDTQVYKYEGEWPSQVRGIVAYLDGEGHPLAAFETTAIVSESASMATTTAPSAAPSPTGSQVSDPPPAKDRSLLGYLILAFLGGVILNVMPCVLPVISLKILSFVKQSQESPAEVRRLGLVFGAGVVTCFMVLGILVIAVRQATGLASWGMQFQSPPFLVSMTVLVTLIALNLLGVFEINLGGQAMGAAGSLTSKEGAAGAFFNGLLVTILATPCTAPFLGVALGFAFAQPAYVVLLTFLLVAFGMAFPYVLLSLNPKWLKFLPKPGAWMESFKKFMAFPMLATAAWLFSLCLNHFSSEGAFGGDFWLGQLLVIVSLCAWVYGEFVQRRPGNKGIPLGIIGVSLVFCVAVILEGQLNWRHPKAPAQAQYGTSPEGEGIRWSPWSPEAVAAVRAEGRPVLVDFTADWCQICQVNLRTSIEVPQVEQRLRDLNAQALIGDFTLASPEIAAELKRFKRAGVPLVLVYPANPEKDPIVLPEALTPGIVLKALNDAAAVEVSSGVK